MPTYEYKCDNCEFRFDLFQSIRDGSKKVCPCCRKHKLRRLIGAGGGILFKGSGFHETDYRSEGYKEAKKAEKTSKEISDE